jgi:hypothetical protein
MPERSTERVEGAPAFSPPSSSIWDWRAEGGAVDGAAAARAARRRGLVRAVVGLVVAAALWLWKPVLGMVAAGVTLGLLAIALVSPGGLYPKVEGGIAAFARGVGLAVSWVTLTLVFFLVVLPLGLVLRALGKLRLDRGPDGPDRSAASYWRAPDTAGTSPARHDRQF